MLNVSYPNLTYTGSMNFKVKNGCFKGEDLM